MFFSVLLLVAAEPPVTPDIPCSVTDRPVVTRKQDLPKQVLEALRYDLADPGELFNKVDGLLPGQERFPFARLICGYSTPTGYVVERERGGRGYSVGREILNKSGEEYVVVNFEWMAPTKAAHA
jgi:hypothetical protein